MVFALIHCGPILPDLAEGVNRQLLPSFWRCWRPMQKLGRVAGGRTARKYASSGAVLRWAGHEKAGAVLAGARLSSCFPSLSPLVAAVRFRPAASLRLGAAITPSRAASVSR